MRRALAVVVAAACSGPKPPGPPHERPTGPPMLAALPKPEAVNTDHFASVIICDRCHTAGERAMRDADGKDISPVTEAQASMMALAARDPYYLAALRRELAANPGAKAAIESLCIRCHAPVGFTESPALGLADLTAGTSPAALLAREGIGCAGCHSMATAGLGTEATFSGKATLRTERISFGALPAPLGEAMLQMSKTMVEPSPHISQSRLCASCHTVLVHPLDRAGMPIGDEIPEQTTYLEWRNSQFQDEASPGTFATTCQGCHMPRGDELVLVPDQMSNTVGNPITTPFSTRPPDAPAREGYRRHTLRGGNAYLLRQLSRNADWLNAASPAARLADSAAATEQFLHAAAELELATLSPHELVVTVHNRTGHKLPTGYPTRRMWLHVTATDQSNQVVLESGATRDGTIVDGAGRRLDAPGAILPHRETIATSDQVIVWEVVPVDAAGKRTHLLLATAKLVKDNRILPAGWSRDHTDAARTKPIGTGMDRSYLGGGGQDQVTVVLPASATRVTVELLYQSIPPETIESYRAGDSLEAARFLQIVRTPPTPLVVATKSLAL